MAVGHDCSIIGPGTKELLYLSQLCVNAHLHLPSPSWVSYGPQNLMVDGALTWMDTRYEGREGVGFVAFGTLLSMCQTYALVFGTPR